MPGIDGGCVADQDKKRDRLELWNEDSPDGPKIAKFCTGARISAVSGKGAPYGIREAQE